MEGGPEKGRVPRQKMPEQPPLVRARNFNEVPLGYSPEMALLEAGRCLQCKKPTCMTGCPVGVKIPEFVKLIREGEFVAAARKVKETNALPAVCGRVCPQEVQCEGSCVLAKKGEPVAIGHLERFCADYERRTDQVCLPVKAAANGRKVAVVGCGPAGLTVAGDLILRGYQVTIFEALHKPGGVLVYGIPEFRLPKEIVDSEIRYLQSLGVELRPNMVVGTSLTVKELMGEMGYDAVFIGVGAGLPQFMGIHGEELCGVYSANEYLTRANLLKSYRFPRYDTPLARGRNVAVVGGGNVAMDSVRTALRLGADNAFIVYRRSIEEMPARREEVHHAQQEGVQFKLLTNPVEVIGDERGWVKALKCIRMELGEPDAKGRRKPVPVKGSWFDLPVDIVVIAIGTNANPLLTSSMQELKLNEHGYIVTDPEGRTSVPGVYAGGDIVTGSATVIQAMGAGRRAANAIHKDLGGEAGPPEACSGTLQP
ncbi:MAG: NADPH-dependent glutamate synthase [Methanomassiliicoccales archaeon]|nr:NADPH-dependent glutamate synthase [Methanomassiliicoccales archaeon]